ncbi:S-layer homology domain-containing protein [Rossellomorea vietnamensis]|uniref:S-layer homology domain-containing protein n=1 Tax=Rossellomorea vietnamensis TaxID=218284 RepID=UPI001653B862|nr:S-layer homology domain-containing protein [Rossellomorea vietnamensis]
MKKLLFVILTTVSLSLSLFSPGTKAAEGFSDVTKNHWANKEIAYISSLGIINGFGDGTFRPNTNVTREHAAIIIGRALQIDISNRPQPKFLDIKKNDQAYPYIAALTDEGVFENVSFFNPSKYLTRAEMAKILVNAFNLEGKSPNQFKDMPSAHWAYPYVSTLVGRGITAGVSEGYYAPGDSVSRAQMVVFIERTLMLNKENDLLNEILRLTNVERSKIGVPLLKMSGEAEPVAMLKAKDLAENAYFSHTSPTYGSPFDMLRDFGVSYSLAGENLFAGSAEPSAAISSWMNSPGHRDNMLNPNFTHMGAGYAQGGPYRHYWVQIFITK